MEDLYQTYFKSKEYFVEPDSAHIILTYDFAVPPYLVWEWLNDPSKRRLWMKATQLYEKDRPRWFLGGICRFMVTKILDIENNWKIMADLMNE